MVWRVATALFPPRSSTFFFSWSHREVIAAGFFGAGVQVAPGRGKRGMAQRLPDGGQVGAAVQGVRSVRVGVIRTLVS